MAERLDINPGEGIGPIQFGMRPAEVRAVFPEPIVGEEWMGGNLEECLLFSGLRLHFTEADGSQPLPNSQLGWIVIHQRPDAFLFDMPYAEWTKEKVLLELRARGFEPQTHENSDMEVVRRLGLSFDQNERLIWVEVYPANGPEA